jgi:ribosomal protein L34E
MCLIIAFVLQLIPKYRHYECAKAEHSPKTDNRAYVCRLQVSWNGSNTDRKWLINSFIPIRHADNTDDLW